MAKASTTGPEESRNVVTGRIGSAARGTTLGHPPFIVGANRFNVDVDCATGTFVGTWRIIRSLDGGATWRRLTVAGVSTGYTADASESVLGIETAEMYDIEVTAFTSGFLVYRFSL